MLEIRSEVNTNRVSSDVSNNQICPQDELAKAYMLKTCNIIFRYASAPFHGFVQATLLFS